MLILTWAPPDQGGEGHVNGHTAEDIELKMKRRGWEKNENLTQDLKSSAEIWWIRNNLQVFLPASKSWLQKVKLEPQKDTFLFLVMIRCMEQSDSFDEEEKIKLNK